MNIPPSTRNRRDFVKSLALAAAGLGVGLPALAQPSAPRGIKLGFDNFSIRALDWKAGRLLDYAAARKLDTMFFSDLKVYDSHEPGYLGDLKRKANDLGVEILVGTYSICPTSKSCTRDYGTPEEHLALAIRIARTLGSPVVRCVLGNSEDRRVEGGIDRQIAETVKVLKSVRSRAMDAGVKIAVENHAGDMQAAELVRLIESAGRDFVGATMDSGNATWALEDPLRNLEILGPYALCTGIRDSVIWESPDGAKVQWTAMGEGDVDFRAYVKRYAELCPKAPFCLEIISGFSVDFPYLKPAFMRAFPDAKAADFAAFLAYARRGKARESFRAPAGQDGKAAERQYQQAELERSLDYCKQTLGLGLKK